MNDFQNQAKNGSKSTKMADRTIFGLSRNLKDRPMIVFLSLGKLKFFGIVRLKNIRVLLRIAKINESIAELCTVNINLFFLIRKPNKKKFCKLKKILLNNFD